MKESLGYSYEEISGLEAYGYSIDVLEKAYKHIAYSDANVKFKNSIDAITNKLKEIVPKNTKILVYVPGPFLDSKLEEFFDNPAKKGIFISDFEGNPTIIIKTQYETKKHFKFEGDLFHPKNFEVFIHEAIHAAITTQLINYYKNNGKGLKDYQKEAIKNLESLLTTFMDRSKWTGVESTQLNQLRKILESIEDPAKRLDEALAYILTNESVINSFASYKLKEDAKIIENTRLGNLLNKIVNSAKSLWKKLVGIIPGSRLDEAIKDPKTGLEFLELFHLNTYSFINDLNNKAPVKKKKDKKSTSESRSFIDLLYSKENDETLDQAIKTSNAIDAMYSKGRSTFGMVRDTNQEAQKKSQKDIDRLNQLEEHIHSYVQSFSEDPDRLSKAMVFFMRDDVINQIDRFHMTRHLHNVRKDLSPTFLVKDPTTASTEELEASKKVYDLIMGKGEFYREFSNLPTVLRNGSANVAMFMALIANEPDIAKHFSSSTLKEPNIKPEFKHPVEAVNTILDKYLTQNSNKLTKDKSLAETAQTIKEEAISRMEPPSSRLSKWRFGNISNELNAKLFDSISSLTIPFKHTRIAKKINSLVSGFKTSPLTMELSLKENIRYQINRIKSPGAANTLKEFVGVIPSNMKFQHLLKLIKGSHDAERKKYLDNFPRYLESKFKNTKVDMALKTFLYRALGISNIQALTDNEVDSLLSKKVRINSLIKDVLSQLESLGADSSIINRKAKQLANYQLGDGHSGNNLLTNAHAIASTLGETEYINITDNNEIIKLTDKLIALHSLRVLPQNDFNKLASIYKNDQEALSDIIKILRHIHEDEMARSKARNRGNFLYNYMAGFIPKGDSSISMLAYVPRSQIKNFKQRGYKLLGKYPSSNIDTSEPLYRMFCEVPIEHEYSEGILQGINQTAFGYLINQGTRNEAYGTKLIDEKAEEYAFNHLC